MNRPDTPKVVMLHRHPPVSIDEIERRLRGDGRQPDPRTRSFNERELAVLKAETETIRLRNERRVYAETSLSDFAAGALAGFVVGFTPFLVMLAVMVLS